MNSAASPLHWSIPCGTWFSTRVRVSVFFPLLIVVLWFQFHGKLPNWFLVANAFGAILFLSVLAHEFGHVVGSRLTGGSGDEILVWPLGGLATVQPLPTFRSRFLTTAAGPFVNLAICLITLGPVWQATPELRRAAFNPFEFPAVALDLESAWLPDLLLLVFTANWIILLVNLIPVYPLDGGRMVQTALATRWHGEAGAEIYLRIGQIAGFLMLLGGLMADSAWAVCIGAFVLLLNVQESVQARTAENYDESFMGYDFSQGYTSLERSVDTSVEHKRPPGFFQRWREKRRHARERRRREQLQQAEQQLDVLLQKVSDHGIQSLTDAERHDLEQASARLRHKDQLDG
ncbi:MAG: site-2 protease family protein [Planctomycetales bacterium]